MDLSYSWVPHQVTVIPSECTWRLLDLGRRVGNPVGLKERQGVLVALLLRNIAGVAALVLSVVMAILLINRVKAAWIFLAGVFALSIPVDLVGGVLVTGKSRFAAMAVT